MRPSANGAPFALSLVFGLGCLGLIAWFLPNDSTVKAQTEKTRLLGKNFSEAKKATPSLVPDQSITVLAVDDGTNEAAAGISGGGTVTGVNRLTPTNYPATITSVSLFFQTQQGLPPASPITILVGTNPSGSANINNISFQQTSAAVETAGSYFFYSIAPVTINSGDFVVGFRATHVAGELPLAIDRTPPMNRRSYVSTGGTTFTLLDDAIPPLAGNLMIRARVQGQPPGCHSVSGINPPSASVGSQVTITGNNFTGVSGVRFFNNVAAQFTVNSNTQITAIVPAGAVTGPITIGKPNCPDTTTAPFTVSSSCTYSINPTSQNVVAGGATANVMVTTQAGCAWTAMSNATWITITSGANGTGSGTVNYSVAVNTGAARNGTMTIAGQTFTVTQTGGGSCTYSINPTFRSISVDGGTGSVAVTTQAGCAWTATSNVTWITITSGANGNGSGAVNYSVASNIGNPARSGTLTIAGRTFTVDQSGCTYALSASSQTFSSAGGSGSVNVTAATGCMWTAASNATWITVNSGASGNGNGTVNYSVAMNTGAARLGTMTIAGRTYTVAQGSDQPTPYRGTWQGMTDQNQPVRFTVDNNDIVVNLEADVRISFFVPPSGQATCTYRLRGEAPAIINNGQFETLLTSTDAILGFQVGAQPNFRATFSSETASSGQITSSTVGLIFCGTNLMFGTINVDSKTWNAQKHVQPGCHSASGINPASGAAGNQVTISGSNFTGVNAVRFANNVNANFTVNSNTQITATVPNGAVTGPITISKPNCPDVTTAAFTVNSACTFAISPASQFFLSGGGTGSVNVTAETGCAWMAMSNAAWITITGGANGSGNGRVDYSVAADPSGGVRSGTMTIAGQTVNVQQGLAAGGGWSRQTSGVTTELRSVHLVSSSEGWAAGANATLLRTMDGGANWSSVNTGADPARGFHTVRFFNSSTGWAGGVGTIARTVNGGANWAKANLPATVLVADNAVHNSFIFSSPTSTFFQSCGQGSVFGDPGSFLYGYTLDANGNLSASGGSVWTPTSPIFDLFSLQDAGGSFTFMVGGNGSIRLLDSSPLGYSSQPSGTNQQLNAIQMMRSGSDLIGWVAGNGGTILKTTNGGSAWTLQSSGTTANLRDVHFVDANRGWVVGDGGMILTTANGGSTWTPESSGVTTDLRGVFFASAEAGFVVGANGVILKRTPQPSAVASVSAASFIGTGFAPESIVAAFGQGLAGSIEIGNTVPLPTTLAGTSVVVRDSAGFDSLANPAATDRLAPLFFVSPGQINLQIPPGTPPGAATINVLRGSAVVASGVVQISSVAPGLFAANASGQGVAAAVVFRRRADGSESFEPVAQFDQAQNRLVPLPIDLGPESDQVFLILYGTGFRFNSGLQAMTVSIGGVNSEVFFAGAAPGFVGLDQANVRLSRSLIGRGEVDVVMIVDGMQANVVKVAIK